MAIRVKPPPQQRLQRREGQHRRGGVDDPAAGGLEGQGIGELGDDLRAGIEVLPDQGVGIDCESIGLIQAAPAAEVRRHRAEERLDHELELRQGQREPGQVELLELELIIAVMLERQQHHRPLIQGDRPVGEPRQGLEPGEVLDRRGPPIGPAVELERPTSGDLEESRGRVVPRDRLGVWIVRVGHPRQRRGLDRPRGDRPSRVESPMLLDRVHVPVRPGAVIVSAATSERERRQHHDDPSQTDPTTPRPRPEHPVRHRRDSFSPPRSTLTIALRRLSQGPILTTSSSLIYPEFEGAPDRC